MILDDVTFQIIFFGTGKPQTLLFSATVPTWVSKASKKYMGEDKKLVDLVGEEGDQTACGVEVCVCFCCCLFS